MFFLGVLLFSMMLSESLTPEIIAIFLVFSVVYFVFIGLLLRPFEIRIDTAKGELLLLQKRAIGFTRTELYLLNDLEFTYKREARSFRSGIKNVLRVYNKNIAVFVLVPDEDDWDKDEITEVARSLLVAGVKRKSLHKHLKDVEV